jgi:uncharacterized pyridoxal phosphate-containing UPF0001 family protein
MEGKWEQMPKDIQWHMIGHVPDNKFMAHSSLIHGVTVLNYLKKSINKL